MPITPFTLNPGSGGPVTPLDDLVTIDGQPAFPSARVPIVKHAWGPPGEANQVSAQRPMPVTSGANTATLVNVNEGAGFDALPAGACRAVFVNNNRAGAVDLEWRRGNAGGTEIIPANFWRLIDAVTDGAQIQMRRADGLAPVVVVSVEYRT